MNELDELLYDSAEKKSERMEKAKKDLTSKLDDKRGRPMGYIYPSKIRDAMQGEHTSITVPMNTGRISSEESEKIKKEKDERSEIFASARVPLFCPSCGETMKSKIDTKFYWIRNKCHKCVAEDETKMRINGTFSDYEKLVILRNKIAFYINSKEEIEEFIKNMKNYTEFVNHDGSIERWSINDIEETKNFLYKELINLDSLIEQSIKEFSELETSFENRTILENNCDKTVIN